MTTEMGKLVKAGGEEVAEVRLPFRGSTIQYSGTPYRANTGILRPRSVSCVEGTSIAPHRPPIAINS